MSKQKSTFEILKTDLTILCNRKKIKQKNDDPSLFQYNTVLEYPRFLDLTNPLLIAGMHGSGPFFYAYQMALQALKKGYVIIDDAGLFEPLLEQGREYANLGFIQEGYFHEIRSSKSITCTKDHNDEYKTIVVFSVEKETPIQFVLKQCQDLEAFEKALIQNKINTIKFSKIGKSSTPDYAPSDLKKIFVTFEFCPSFKQFKNRIHLRDTYDNMKEYGIDRAIHGSLHSSKLGYGFALIENHKPSINHLYFLAS